MKSDGRPIGVFDSGVGGLTLVRALRTTLPAEDIFYLGDTARLPYGTKSPDTIRKYALSIGRTLATYDIKALVVACNSACAHALMALQQDHPALLVIGVLDPGAKKAAQLSQSGRILVLATEATSHSDAYQTSIRQQRPDAQVITFACPVLVALAEEGWTTGPVASAAVATYLDDCLRQMPFAPDTVLLGCTHFPLMAPVIAKTLPEHCLLTDSAEATADELRAALTQRQLLNTSGGALRLFATDDAQRFARIGRRFLGEDIKPEAVEVLNL